MSWTLEKKVSISGVAAAVGIFLAGWGAWDDVKDAALAADNKINEHIEEHEKLEESMQNLELDQAVVKEQIFDLREDVSELKRAQERGFDEILRALGRGRATIPGPYGREED